jgi:AcrR family transcriptional regulator
MADMEKINQKKKLFRQREEGILSSALSLFLEQGEEYVTVAMIAEKTGIGKGTIYKHFTSIHEIYLRLLLSYEEELAELFGSISLQDNKDRLAREYFRFRMQDPKRYALFYRLESKCIQESKLPDLMEKLHKIRLSNIGRLKEIISARIEEGVLEDVPPYFHMCAAWALVHGAVALYHSDFFGQHIENKQRFFEFLMDIGVRMGNRGQYRKPTVLMKEEHTEIKKSEKSEKKAKEQSKKN